MRQIESDEVMPQQECQTFCKCIQLLQFGMEVFVPTDQRPAVVTADRSKLVNAVILDAYFKVDGKAAWPEISLTLPQFAHRIGSYSDGFPSTSLQD
jgi:hypothetical protein